jgi:hypothetical protein
MTVQQKQFRSEFGFRSPEFLVDDSGNLTAGSLTTANLNSTTISIAGAPIIESNRITENITNSSLETLGILQSLTVNGDVLLRKNNITRLSVINGRVVVNSLTTGSIDNIDIGQTTPGKVNTYQLNVIDRNGVNGEFVADGANISFDAATITGTVTYVENISVNAAPTSGLHLARKDYVDNSVIAFAVAFGA